MHDTRKRRLTALWLTEESRDSGANLRLFLFFNLCSFQHWRWCQWGRAILRPGSFICRAETLGERSRHVQTYVNYIKESMTTMKVVLGKMWKRSLRPWSVGITLTLHFFSLPFPARKRTRKFTKRDWDSSALYEGQGQLRGKAMEACWKDDISAKESKGSKRRLLFHGKGKSV